MSLRISAAVAACWLAVGAVAQEKKKLECAPETGPQPRTVEALPPDPPRPPFPRTVKQIKRTIGALWPSQTWIGGMTLPSPHYLEGHPPQYFPEEPQFPPAPELTYQESVIKVYHVGDLVTPIPAAGSPFDATARTREAELIKKLTAAVEPKCWVAVGGPATVDYYPLGMTLVVNAPASIQDAVAKYLDRVRKVQDTQFAIELKVLTVSAEGLEQMGLARDFLGKPGELRTRVKFLAADELGKLDLHGPDYQAATMPRLTVLNDQEGTIDVGEVQHFLTGVTVDAVQGSLVFTPKNEPHQLGITSKVRATLSADGKYIKLSLLAQSRDLTVKPVSLIPLSTKITPVKTDGEKLPAVPFTQYLQDPRIVTRTVDETVTMPDGGTVVFYGGPATTEETTWDPLPLFADIPILGELMSREKKVTGTNHLVVVATARAIRPDGDECVQCAGGTGKLPRLMLDYHRACRDGNAEEARRLALECIVLDPTCFSKK